MACHQTRTNSDGSAFVPEPSQPTQDSHTMEELFNLSSDDVKKIKLSYYAGFDSPEDDKNFSFFVELDLEKQEMQVFRYDEKEIPHCDQAIKLDSSEIATIRSSMDGMHFYQEPTVGLYDSSHTFVEINSIQANIDERSPRLSSPWVLSNRSYYSLFNGIESIIPDQCPEVLHTSLECDAPGFCGTPFL